MKKAVRALHRTAFVTTADVRFRRALFNCAGPEWFHAGMTILQRLPLASRMPGR
jgi:hypothetical protein